MYSILYIVNKMIDIFKINKALAFIAYISLDILSVGMGMGIPIFCILLGFPVGLYLSKRLKAHNNDLNIILGEILKYGFFLSLITLILMMIVWIPFSTMLLDPHANFKNFGIPLILYDPKMSFIGWMILMIFISPFLQLLTTIFTSNVALWRLSKSENR